MILFPTGTDPAAWPGEELWEVHGAGSSWEAIDDIPSDPPRVDASFITFRFLQSPREHFTFRQISLTESVSGKIYVVESVVFKLRATRATIGGVADNTVNVLDRSGGTYGVITISGANRLVGVFFDHYLTLTTNPISGASWTAADINGGFTLDSSQPGPSLYPAISQFSVTVNLLIPGSGLWHKGPHRRERVRIDSISGAPFHESELVQIRDPRHPHHNLWMRPEEVDGINPEPTSPNYMEGELRDEDD